MNDANNFRMLFVVIDRANSFVISFLLNKKAQEHCAKITESSIMNPVFPENFLWDGAMALPFTIAGGKIRTCSRS